MHISRFKQMTYLNSEQHINNFAHARQLSYEKNSLLKIKRIHDYSLNPKRCNNICCSNILPYEKRGNRFCCHSCSATTTNSGRKRNNESKKKISNILKGRKSPNKGKSKYDTFTAVCCKNCKICGKLFYTKGTSVKHTRQTCSRACNTHASVKVRKYQNGSRKPQLYFCKILNKEILLDSSWEIRVAQLLDTFNIKWIRPHPIKWKDENNQDRLYYPDFYLLDHQLYLDPKNPYCMEKDTYKMMVISQLINIEYGDITHIENMIQCLANGRGMERCPPSSCSQSRGSSSPNFTPLE